ncbi:MAG: TIR domain-containing protein [Muribaculaceae bacterium]|nr:TIR domain-containing protein [Muribaculaceae bacterium]
MEKNVKTLKCPNCGAALNLAAAKGGVVRCEYCDSPVTLPKIQDEKVTLKLELGKDHLYRCDFDGAYNTFSEIANTYPDEPEAYYGMALAEFRIQLIHDKVNNRLQPICHEATNKRFTDGKNYKKALDKASGQNERVLQYKAQGAEIDDIMSKFYGFSKQGINYDAFICVKVTEENGKHTEDSHTADDIYHELIKRGYKPFYSEREIKGKTGADYEALILYALHVSRCMLVICSDESYLRTPWVANEYTRYIELMGDGRKRNDSIALVFNGAPIEKIPGIKNKIQGINSAGGDAYLRIIDYINKFPATLDAPKIKRKEYEKTTFEAKKTIETNIQKRTLTVTGNKEPITASESAKLKLAGDFLKSGDFAHAKSYAEEILQNNRNLPEAYWILFLAENKCADDKKFVNLSASVASWDNFEHAIASSNKYAAKQYYIALVDKVNCTHDFSAYEEYFALPDSDANIGSELTQKMFDFALSKRNCELFDKLIKYVDKVDVFIAMNTDFARNTRNLKYYEAVLSVDNGNTEALWYVFLDKDVSGRKLKDYCFNKDNFDVIEKKLFSYGFNELAFYALYDVALDNIGEARSGEFVDFILSLIPARDDSLYNECCQEVLYCALAEKNWQLAEKYNNIQLDINKYNYEAHFIACLIANETVSIDKLRKKCDLIDDENFKAAMTCYAEKNPSADNIFLKIAQDTGDSISALKNIKGRYVFLYRTKPRYSCLADVVQGQKNRDNETVQRQQQAAKDRKAFNLKLIIGIIAGVLGAGLAALGIALGISSFSGGNPDLPVFFMKEIPVLLSTVICIYVCCSVLHGTKLIRAIVYAITCAAIVFMTLFLAFIIFIWCKPEWFEFKQYGSYSWKTIGAPIPTWATVLMFIGGIIVLAQLIIGFISERLDDYFTPEWLLYENPVIWVDIILTAISSLFFFAGSFAFTNAVTSALTAIQNDYISAFSGTSIALLVFGVISYGLLLGDNDTVHDTYFIVHAVFNCVKAGLFVLCALSVFSI